MISYDLLRCIRTDLFNVQFIIYGSCSKRKVHNLVLGIWLERPCLLVYKKTGWELYPRPIEGVQVITGRKIRGRCEPQSQLLVKMILFYCYFIFCLLLFLCDFMSNHCLLFMFTFELLSQMLHLSFDKHTTLFTNVYHYVCYQDP